jgi:hypothetical protein
VNEFVDLKPILGGMFIIQQVKLSIHAHSLRKAHWMVLLYGMMDHSQTYLMNNSFA